MNPGQGAGPVGETGPAGDRLAGDGATLLLNVTGSVYVDLTDVPEDKARLRLGSVLQNTPAGAEVVVYVGPLAVLADCVWMARSFGGHVRIHVTGEPYAVPKWVDALREGSGWLL